MSTPLVSIVVATYNQERFIAQNLESLLAQKAPFPYEILVGNDASTDDTAGVIAAIAAKHPGRLTVFNREKNMGTRVNAADLYSMARGEYLASCEGDDFWNDPDKLRLQVEAIRSRPEVVLVHSDFYQLSQDTGRTEICRAGEVAPRNGRTLYEAILISDYQVRLCTALTSRQARSRLRAACPELSDRKKFMMGDTPKWLELSRIGEFIHIPKPLATYRQLSSSTCRSDDPARDTAFQINSIEMIEHFCAKYPISPGFRKQVMLRICERALWRAYRTKNLQLADEIRKHQPAWNHRLALLTLACKSSIGSRALEIYRSFRNRKRMKPDSGALAGGNHISGSGQAV